MSQQLAPADQTQAPVVDTPVADAPADTTGTTADASTWNFLDTVEPDPAEGTEAAAPLPTDARAEDAGADTETEQPRAEAGGQVEEEEGEKLKAEAAGDPELTPEENALVESRPEAERPETARKLKAAKFEDHFKNPDKPAEEVSDYLKNVSPARYGELEQSILSKRLAEPDQFCQQLHASDKEAYGKLARAVFDGAPEYFARAIAGRDVDPETIAKALDAYEAGTSDLPAPVEYTEDEKAEIRNWLGDDNPELVEKILGAATKPAAQPAKKDQPAPEAKAEVKPEAKPEDKKPDEKKEPEPSPQSTEAWMKAEESLEDYLTSKADREYRIVATNKERELTPDVADLKDEKLEVLRYGRTGQLPAFYPAFFKWGEGKPAFQEVIKQVTYYAEKGETANAVSAAKKMLSLVDQFTQERLKHPVFQRLDARIKRASEEANPPTDTDTLIAGTPPPSQPGAANTNPWSFPGHLGTPL